MQPPSTVNSTHAHAHTRITPEHRARLCQILNELDDEQLRVILTNYLTNSTNTHQFQHYTRSQLFQQCLILIDNAYSTDLEQTIHAMRQKHFPSDYYRHPSQQQRPPPPPSANYPISMNPSSYRYSPPSYRFPTPQPPTPTLSPQHRQLRPLANSAQQARYPLPPQQPQPIRPIPPSIAPIPSTPSTPSTQRYQVPILPSSSRTSISGPSTFSPVLAPTSTITPSRPPINKILHKNLPFYRTLACVYERFYVFHYDQYRKQHMSLDEFLLSFDACNQLALSYDYDPVLNVHKTSRCLLLRLARIDQAPAHNGKYDDNLPPNVTIQVNGHPLTNLPIPKPCARQHSDLIRTGREIDITSHCMFNPMLKNEIKIIWSCRPENTNLHMQYANAQYALHVFLVEHLAVDYLCEQILKKPARFLRHDLMKLVAKARATDQDLGLEVSDQKLKLTCSIDQRRMKKPIRATTCQHLQCFDLSNYIALNEKANKWICPVCNKYALFDDLQIDTYMETILNSIPDGNITEITVNGDLLWTPVVPPKTMSESATNNQSKIPSHSSATDFILIDDEE